MRQDITDYTQRFEVQAPMMLEGKEVVPVLQQRGDPPANVSYRHWHVTSDTRQLIASMDFNLFILRPVRAFYTPPIATPLAMVKGQTYAVETRVDGAVFSTFGPDLTLDGAIPNSAFSTPQTYTTTYLGRETIVVPAGTFDTCRIRLPFWDNAYQSVKDLEAEEWVVASGPYRGLTVKSRVTYPPGTPVTSPSASEAVSLTVDFK